jgi:hypothetical protein
MRQVLALLLLTWLAACANPSCRNNQDGGIGGTGGCVQAPAE